MKNEEDPEFVARLCAEILRELEVERPRSAHDVILYSHLDRKKVRKYLRILIQKGLVKSFYLDGETVFRVTPAGSTFVENQHLKDSECFFDRKSKPNAGRLI